jgi:hypothetical protein
MPLPSRRLQMLERRLEELERGLLEDGERQT